MPFVIVSCDVTVSTGPTIVGDEASDETLMESLGASLVQAKCQTYKHFVAPHAPRLVMDELERQGFQLVGSSGVGQTIVWTFSR
ncbi:hypothetical protein LEN26_016768 [Aphanomyces euteiches]|nr:hypothetical protein LEN26_016768 [Aphanomyces euteiches]KAH9111930.1 hypothetical protein AeMF1_013642 [Aphanomyces euteiches]